VAQKFTTGITVRDLASAASDAVAVSVAGDTNDRIKFEAGGKVVWGSGAAAGDVNLYRDAADRLKTDDALQADGGLITVTTAGTPTLSLPDGALAIDTTNNLLYIRTGGAWEIASGGGASVTTSDGAPADPEDGDLWYETDTGSMFVYYDDGASQQWVEVGTAGVIAMTTQSTAPSSPSNGDLWFDTDTAKTYLYYDDGSSQQWVEVGAASAAASGTDGAIQFASGGTFSSDASNLVWDDTNNRLGIGTTNPARPLEVDGGSVGIAATFKSSNATGGISLMGSGTTDDTRVRIGAEGDDLKLFSNNIERVRIDSSGNVGIGTTTPAAKLDVSGSGVLSKFSGTGNPRLQLIADDDSDPYITLGNNTDNAIAGLFLDSSTESFQIRGNDFNARMTIDSSGNVGIGTTTPNVALHVNGKDGVNIPMYVTSTDTVAGIALSDVDSTSATKVIIAAVGDDMRLSAGGAERMRIDSNGNVGINGNPSIQPGSEYMLFVEVGSGGGINIDFPTTATTSGLIKGYSDVGGTDTLQFVVRTDGDFESRTNSYGATSDATIKQDIVDASSQWDDIKSVQLRKYRLIDDVAANGDAALVQLGVVAQELEAAGLGGLVVDADPDNDKPYKSVKYSVLLLKALGALQEAMARIEALEAN